MAAILSTTIACFHVSFYQVAGPLWRDEITSVALATQSHFDELWTNLRHDSFPLLWPLTLRLWTFLGLGRSDESYRLLGLFVGLSIIAILWKNARSFGVASPVASLLLLGFGNANLCYVDSIRGYGLGILLGMLAFGMLWDLTRQQTAWRVIAALIACLLSVHTLYFNSVWLFAACVGAASGCLVARNRRAAVMILLIGFTCALSMLIYVPAVRGRGEINGFFQAPISYGFIFRKLKESLTITPLQTGWLVSPFLIWSLAVLSALAIAGYALFGRKAGADRGDQQRRSLAVFAAVTLLIGVPAYGTFLLILKYRLPPWYFLAAIAMIAGCIDALLACNTRPAIRAVICLAAVAVAAVNGWYCETNAQIRMTSIDVAARFIEREATRQDLVLVSPWWLGTPFQRNYNGDVEWMTIPPMQKAPFQRYDLLMPFLHDDHAVDSVVQRCIEVEKSGHRVFIVCVQPSVYGLLPMRHLLDPGKGYDELSYYTYWDQKVIRTLKEYGTIGRSEPVTANGVEVFPDEMIFCSIAQGNSPHR